MWINIKLRKIFYAHKNLENKTKDACVEIGKCTENYGINIFAIVLYFLGFFHSTRPNYPLTQNIFVV